MIVGRARVAALGDTLGGTWRSVLTSAGARVIILPVNAVLGLLSTRLIIEHFGQGAYLQYGLLVGIAALLPFADLGISAAIMNAVGESDHPARDDRVRRVLITSMRILFGAMVVIVMTAVVLTLAGAWPPLLGEGLLPGSGPIAAGLCLGVYGLNLLVGFGERILIGLGKNHVAILVLGLQTPVMLVVIVVVTLLGLPAGGYLAVMAYVVLLVLGAVMLARAARLVRPVVGQAARAARHVRTERGGRVFDVGWPLLVQMVALPVALQTDRIVVSHLSSLDELAKYTLGSQLFAPVLAVIGSAGAVLWPIFARARAQGSDEGVTSPNTLAVGFAAAAAVVCVVIAAVSPWLAAGASDGSIELPVSVLAAFSALMVVQAARYPLGSYLTDAPGLRFQAWLILGMLPVNLALSVLLTPALGAVGPLLGSIVSMTVFQLFGTWWFVRRERRRRAANGGSHVTA